MAKPKVFVTRIIPEAGMKLLQEHTAAEIWPEKLPPPYDVLIKKVQGVDGILCLLTDKMDGPLMDAAGPQLKVISQMAVGYDNIDVRAASARGIAVGHTPGALTESTADFAWALLMAAARRVVEAHDYTRAGHWKTWDPLLLLGPDVYGATLGLVGFGRIGQAVARRGRGFNMRVLYHDVQRYPEAEKELNAEYLPLDELLAQADYVSIHTWLSPDTRGLFNLQTFQKMKPSAILINTARGPVVDPAALYQALKEGLIAYAALDVTDPEPLPPDSPLLALPNIIIAPHIASGSLAARSGIAELAARNLIAGVNGENLPHCVNATEIFDKR